MIFGLIIVSSSDEEGLKISFGKQFRAIVSLKS
jgi:hypothetical protein